MTKKRIASIFVALVLVCSALAALVACKDPAVLTDIKITTEPTKTTYIAGEKFDPAGMVISAVYSDESTKALEASAWTYSPDGALETSAKSITISYTEGEVTKTVRQAITVTNDVTEVTVKTPATKTSYLVGEKFNPAGMVLTVKYQNGDMKDIVVADDASVTYSKDALKAGDTEIVLTIGGKTVKQPITIAKGVFIEAEDGLINGVSIVVADEGRGDSQKYIRTDAAGKTGEEAKYNASGDLYLGEVVANDVVTFVFKASAAGKADISFRLASKYLKEDSNWTPIWMGDCQFNKICEVSVNGIAYPIPDSVILPGGGESGGSPNGNLWLNWQEVPFTGIDIIEGINEIALKFLPHDYNDCSQSAFNGTFTANIDSIIVTTDVDVEAVEPEQPDPPVTINATITPVSGDIVEENGVAYVVISGTIVGEEYTKAQLEEILKNYYMDFQKNGYNGGSWTGSWDAYVKTASKVVLDDNGNYSCYYDVTDLDAYLYTTHYGPGAPGGDNAGADFKPAEAFDKTITIGERTYRAFVVVGSDHPTEAWGNIGLEVTGEKTAVTPVGTDAVLTAKDVKLVLENGEPVLIVTGEVTYTVGTPEQVALDLINRMYFDVEQQNVWQRYKNTKDDWNITFTAGETGKGTFELKVNVASLGAGKFTTHFNRNGNDYGNLNKDVLGNTVTGGTVDYMAKNYKITYVPESGEQADFWGNVGIDVVSTATYTVTATSGKLAEENGRVYTVICGTVSHADYTVEEMQQFLLGFAFNYQHNQQAGAANWDTVNIKATKAIVKDGTFEVWYDITDLAPSAYTSHFDGKDVKPAEAYNESVTVGGKTYNMVVVPGSGEGKDFWGCIGLYVTAAEA